MIFNHNIVVVLYFCNSQTQEWMVSEVTQTKVLWGTNCPSYFFLDQHVCYENAFVILHIRHSEKPDDFLSLSVPFHWWNTHVRRSQSPLLHGGPKPTTIVSRQRKEHWAGQTVHLSLHHETVIRPTPVLDMGNLLGNTTSIIIKTHALYLQPHCVINGSMLLLEKKPSTRRKYDLKKENLSSMCYHWACLTVLGETLIIINYKCTSYISNMSDFWNYLKLYRMHELLPSFNFFTHRSLLCGLGAKI